MVLPSQEIVSTHVCYSNKGICALLTQLSGRYIEKTMCTLPRDCTYSAAKLPSWLESILIIVSVYSGDPVIDSREDQPEWLWRASCRAAYGLQEFKEKKKNSLVPDIYRFTSPLWVVFLLWLDTQNLMRGLPPICQCTSSLRVSPNDISTVRGYICKNYLIWDKLVQATESCTDNASCANLDPESSWFAFHWLLRWSSWGNKSSLDFPYSVEDVSRL